MPIAPQHNSVAPRVRWTRKRVFEWLRLVLGLAMLGGFLVYLTKGEQDKLIAQHEQQLSNQARVVHDYLTHQLTSIDRTLLGLQKELPVWQRKGNDPAEANLHLSALAAAMPAIRSLVILDATGTTTASSRPELIGQDFAHKDYFLLPFHHPDPGVFYLTPPQADADNAWVSHAVRMVPGENGAFLGVLVAAIDSDHIAMILESVRNAPDMWAELAHGQGKMISMRPMPHDIAAINVVQHPDTPESRHLASGRPQSRFVGADSRHGPDTLMAQITLQPANLHLERPLIVGVGRDRRAVLQAWRHEAAIYSGLYVIVVLIAVASLALMQRRRQHSEAAATEAETTLRESEARYRLLTENSPLAIQVFAPDGSVLRVNHAWEQLWQLPFSALRDYRLFNDRQLEENGSLQALRRAFAGESIDLAFHEYDKAAEASVSSAPGKLWIHARAYPSVAADGRVQEVIVIQEDVTDRITNEEKLRRAASVFAYAREGIIVTTIAGEITDANQAFTYISGYAHDELIGQNPRLLASGRHAGDFFSAMWQALITQDHWSGEVWNRRKDGSVYAASLTISTVFDMQGRPLSYVGMFSDVTVQKEHQFELEQIAHYDALTHLPNRVLLGDRLRQGMAQTVRREQLLGVAFIDLDGFKPINDRFGHDAGDRFLIELAQRLKNALREGDTIARLGGDEFVAIFLDINDRSALQPMLQRVLDAAASPVLIDGHELRVTASIGFTTYPQENNDVDADQLLRQADQAMYQAKLDGKNRVQTFDIDEDRHLRGRHEHFERIREALERNEFVLYYQPKVNMRTGEVVGAEALIRWLHPEQGLLPPASFLPLIEDHHLAIDIGEWVIKTALAQIAIWQEQGLSIPVSVNIGARQLQQENFIERISLMFAYQPGIAPGMLQLEVLESSALEDIQQVSYLILACRAIGVHFALDDFGTGYSSLTYLKRLPASVLKIDQSFVRDMLDDPDDLAILEGILGLASAFSRDVVAEGVETVAHGQILLQLGCETAQGYGIARPMPAADIPAWAARWKPDPTWLRTRRMSRDQLPILFARIEHQAWITRLRDYLQGRSDTPPTLDPAHCRFGAWLQRHTNPPPDKAQIFTEITRLHEAVHIMGREMTFSFSHGEHEHALARLPALEKLRDTLIGLLGQLIGI